MMAMTDRVAGWRLWWFVFVFSAPMVEATERFLPMRQDMVNEVGVDPDRYGDGDRRDEEEGDRDPDKNRTVPHHAGKVVSQIAANLMEVAGPSPVVVVVCAEGQPVEIGDLAATAGPQPRQGEMLADQSVEPIELAELLLVKSGSASIE